MITLHNGDCLDYMHTLPAQSVDAILTDLPYGTTACAWDMVIPFEPMWEAVKHVLKPDGAFITTASQPFTSLLINSNLKWFKYCWVWIKNKPTGGLLSDKMPMRSHEDIVVFYNKTSIFNPQKIRRSQQEFKLMCRVNNTIYGHQHGIYGHLEQNKIRIRPPKEKQWLKNPVSYLFFNRDEKRDGSNHSTQKPVALYKYLVQTYTNPGDTVLDMCMGSGTTGVACVETGRDFIGCETEEEHFLTAENRIKEASRQGQLFTPKTVNYMPKQERMFA
jgi:site-specific DNA-methyltransferase (adenine-specific)